MWEELGWKIEETRKNFFDGLEPTANRPIKRPISEEYQIITSYLHEYLDLERGFNEYELGWMSIPPSLYYPNLVREFFAIYLALLEKDFPKVTEMTCRTGHRFL